MMGYFICSVFFRSGQVPCGLSCFDGVFCEKRWVMMVCFPPVESTTSGRNHLNI